jgi:hypothetical protein
MRKFTWEDVKFLIEIFVISILLLWALSMMMSCVTEKKCNAKFPPKVEYIKKDSIVYKEKIVKRDTIIYKYLTKDSIIKETNIVYSKDSAWFPPMVAKGKYGSAKAWSYRGKAFLNYFEGGMAIEMELKDAITERDRWMEKYLTESRKEQRTFTVNSPFAKFCIGFFFGVIGLSIIGLVFVRIRK